MKIGICKFGVICKFYYFKDNVGIVGRVLLNILGYLFRSVEFIFWVYVLMIFNIFS